MERIIENARRLRANLTDAEHRLWKHLRKRQFGIKFRRQAPVGRYILDFVSFDRKLVIELDGGQHASCQTYDGDRTAWLESQGFRVLRFWNHDVLLQVDVVLSEIMAALNDVPPTLTLPHEDGGREF